VTAERVTAALRAANDEGRAGLLIYLPAGYPDLDTSVACMVAAAEAGADVIEVGFPFSDPMMDGPTIQAANQVALDAGYTIDDDFEVCRKLTAQVDVPCLPMTYVTIADVRGYDQFAKDCADAGLDGVILPDLPADEAGPWVAAARGADLATVFLASSVSTDERLEAIGDVATGFVYAAGLLGVTGVKDVAQDDSEILVGRVREHTDLPVAVGIGIKTPEDAYRVAAYADGVIVGSRAVQAASDGATAQAPDRVRDLVAALRDGCRR